MNSSLRHTTVPLIQVTFQRLRSCDWIEVVALPVAAAIMEAQPIIVGLWLAGLVLTGKKAPLVLDPATILFLLLGLHWWAMGGGQFQQAGSSERRSKGFHLIGLCLALALTIGLHLALIEQPLALSLAILVVLWCWQRGMMRIQMARRDEHLKTIFQRALFVLLAIVVLVAIAPSMATRLLPPLTLAFPLFFLSGLVTFSLLRLRTTGQAYRKRFPNSRRADPTRLWSIMVALLWMSVVAVAFLAETVAFPLLVLILAPLLTLLAKGSMIVNAFFEAFLRQPSTPPVRLPEKIVLHKQLPQPAFHDPVLVVILTLIAVGTMGLLLVMVVRIWYSNYRYAQEDEMRRGIALRSVLRERLQKRVSAAREQLDPTSVRAQYREFLRLMARHGTNLERLPQETPRVYQKRLHGLVEMVSPQHQERFSDAVLDELTQAYMQERYGGKYSDDRPYTYWQIHIRAFVKRFRQLSRKHDPLVVKEEG